MIPGGNKEYILTSFFQNLVQSENSGLKVQEQTGLSAESEMKHLVVNGFYLLVSRVQSAGWGLVNTTRLHCNESAVRLKALT